MSRTLLLLAAVITSIDAVKSTSRSGILAASGNGGGSPIVKAVEMLEGLQTKITDATKQEQDSYLKFTLWCQNESQATQFQIRSTEQKKAMFTADIAKSTADMAAASTHLAEIAQYESTDEADLKAATLLREKEAADFKALELELVNGIRTTQAAQVKLQQDIVAAGGEVAAAENAAFLQQKQPSKAMKAFSDVMVELTKAAALTSSDDMKTYPSLLEQLERSADGEVRFQKPQDAAVGTLQDNLQLLKDVEAKSQASLDAARAKEKRQQSDFLKLKNALSGKIQAMKQDLESTKKALADATATKANAEGEVAVCEQDIKTAKEFLVQVERGCMEKAGQFQQQKKNREDEVQAIMGALKALRGVMTSKRSKPSGLSFLQLSSGRSKELHHLALRKVQQLAVAMQSPALNQLASKMTALARYGGEDVFAKMRKLIQEMISALEQTNREEMGKKAFCDQEMKHTKSTLSDRQDESKRKSAALELTTAQVAQLREELANLAQELSELAESDQELTKMRQAEHEEHTQAYKELEFGLAGVQTAIKALRDYYSQDRPVQLDMAASMALAADGRAPRVDIAEVSTAGAGVISFLEVVESDFARNMADLQSQDRNAQEAYEKLMQQSKVVKAQKESDVKHKTTEATNLERSATELRSDTASAKQQLEAVTEYLGKLQEECTAKVETREERMAKRQKEMEGLQEALSILESAVSV
mmetsp:Transcript_62005/g.101362  ORF Transcript_62005/g.101362 Transcript_62005/m.101362 type:complete len:707 (+) Transcript_62005:2-2122(+)